MSIEIKVSEYGICTVKTESTRQGSKLATFLLDAFSIVELDEKKLSIRPSAGGPEYSYTFTDAIQATMEYDHLVRYIVACAEGIGRRPERRLRDVEIILENEKCEPRRGSEKAAGYDCYADIDALSSDPSAALNGTVLTISPNATIMVPLGFRVDIRHSDYALFLMPRSGKGSKGQVLGNLTGVIDADYQGVVKACIWNRTDKDLEVNLEDAVCQAVFKRVELPEFHQVSEFSPSTRGDKGFGSTDKVAE